MNFHANMIKQECFKPWGNGDFIFNYNWQKSKSLMPAAYNL